MLTRLTLVSRNNILKSDRYADRIAYIASSPNFIYTDIYFSGNFSCSFRIKLRVTEIDSEKYVLDGYFDIRLSVWRKRYDTHHNKISRMHAIPKELPPFTSLSSSETARIISRLAYTDYRPSDDINFWLRYGKLIEFKKDESFNMLVNKRITYSSMRMNPPYHVIISQILREEKTFDRRII